LERQRKENLATDFTDYTENKKKKKISHRGHREHREEFKIEYWKSEDHGHTAFRPCHPKILNIQYYLFNKSFAEVSYGDISI
jgi:hypothetical protein